MSCSATDEEVSTGEISSDGEENVEITVNILGNPRLPKILVADLKACQDLC